MVRSIFCQFLRSRETIAVRDCARTDSELTTSKKLHCLHSLELMMVRDCARAGSEHTTSKKLHYLHSLELMTVFDCDRTDKVVLYKKDWH